MPHDLSLFYDLLVDKAVARKAESDSFSDNDIQLVEEHDAFAIQYDMLCERDALVGRYDVVSTEHLLKSGRRWWLGAMPCLLNAMLCYHGKSSAPHEKEPHQTEQVGSSPVLSLQARLGTMPQHALT